MASSHFGERLSWNHWITIASKYWQGGEAQRGDCCSILLATLHGQRRTGYRSTGLAVVQDFCGLLASIRRIEDPFGLQPSTLLDCAPLSLVKPLEFLYPYHKAIPLR